MAELSIRIYGRNSQILFREALIGIMNILHPGLENGRAHVNRKITVKAKDLSSLLVEFLNQANKLRIENKEIYNDLAVEQISDNKVVAELRGFPIEKVSQEIKNVLSSSVGMKKNIRSEWETVLVLDVG
jgi:SHS2 domain-containing protein